MTARNAERNGAVLDTAVYRWDAPPEALGRPWPLVLASDVLYEGRNVPVLLDLLPRLTAASGEIWLADPGRAPAAGFLEAAAATWRVDAVPHDGPGHVTVHRLRPAPLSAPGTP
jgi:predicted nicotinamide N-methyase